MANTAVGKMTLVSGLLIMAPWFFTSIKLTTPVSFPVDVALIVMPNKYEEGEFYRQIVNLVTDHFEFGEDKAKLALVTAYFQKGKEIWVMLPLTANVDPHARMLVNWPPRYSNPVRDYGAALRALPTVFTNSSDRAKAAIMFFMTPPTSDDVNNMVTTSQQLRDDGVNIYATAHENDTLSRSVAENITGATERVIVASGEEFHFQAYLDGAMPGVFKVIDKDLANRITTPPTPAPTQPPTQKPAGSTSAPSPAGKSTTTSRGVVAKPTPPLQWASCLLIGLAVTPFRFMI